MRKWVRGRPEASPSPLSRWGQFPTFTGVRLSRTGRPHSDCPLGGTVSIRLSWPLITEAFQREQAEPVQDFVAELFVVVGVLSLGFHAPEAHANPRVQLMEHFPTREEPGGKVLGRSPNNSVEFLNPRSVQVMLTAGQFPNLVFELLHRLGPHAP